MRQDNSGYMGAEYAANKVTWINWIKGHLSLTKCIFEKMLSLKRG